MEKTVLESYLKAGKILKEVLAGAKKNARQGMRLLDFAEGIEKQISELGGKPAFPVNLSLNEAAAHFSPSEKDETIATEKDVLKVDIGVQVDGYIADAAFTLDFSGEHGKMVEAAEKALENALSLVKEGQRIGKIGAEIERTIKGYGFNPIQNLSGHSLGRFEQHAAPEIPNIAKQDERELEDSMAFAIEPFATNGKGFVREGMQSEIFALEEPRPVRNPIARQILELVEKEFETLPFAERWIAKRIKASEFQLKIALRELLQSGCIRAFPVLKEEAGKTVTQAENTIILNNGEVILLV